MYVCKWAGAVCRRLYRAGHRRKIGLSAAMLFRVCAYMRHVLDDKYMYLLRTESFTVSLSARAIEHARTTGNHKGSTGDHKGSSLQITYGTGRQLQGTPQIIEEDRVEE